MKGRLSGKTVLLSASVPSLERSEEYQRVPDAHVKVEEAVISLARAVFFEGGRLVFGGHPSISPLVALVAGEYLAPRAAEGGEQALREGAEREPSPVLIYQSRAFEGYLPDDTWLLHRLGHADIRWTEALEGERFNPKLKGVPQCPKSLKLMRTRMIDETSPMAMVCIGGMEGVEDELRIFQELGHGAPVYVLATTGGAAYRIAATRVPDVRVIDWELETEIADRRRELPRKEEEEKTERYTPYPLILQTIVEELGPREG